MGHLFFMENPLYWSKSYFSGQKLAKFRQRKTLIGDDFFSPENSARMRKNKKRNILALYIYIYIIFKNSPEENSQKIFRHYWMLNPSLFSQWHNTRKFPKTNSLIRCCIAKLFFGRQVAKLRGDGQKPLQHTNRATERGNSRSHAARDRKRIFL